MVEYNPISVTDLNKYIKEKIDGDEILNNVLVYRPFIFYTKRRKFTNKMCNV